MALRYVPLIKPGDDLATIILETLENNQITLHDNDILVLAQKIVSKAENQYRFLSQVTPSQRALELSLICRKDPALIELILQESQDVIRVKPNVLIVEHRLGFISANAGIDQSNVKQDSVENADRVLLLPKNPDLSAARIRTSLEKVSNKKLGVMVIDSHGRPWRLGTMGTTIGLSGVPGVIDMRGIQDMFGYELQYTEVAVADELAAAASLVMGQAAEAQPIVHVRDFPYQLSDGNLKEIIRPKEFDLFR
ncbi:MAG: coenzyme F420-0:L-glutamate ligase [Bacteroidales bacterium]|nr:coenzyme F420-0:L-glutamate ligase [Bacteroidales bacterium]